MSFKKVFTEVAGIPVVAQQDASLTVAGRLATSQAVQELLLENGQTVYGCAHSLPAARNCTYTAPTAHSVTAHQRTHSAKSQVQKTYRNRVAGAVKAAETKKRKAANGVAQVEAGLDELARQLHEGATLLRNVAASLEQVARNLPERDATSQAELERLRQVEQNYQTIKGLLS